MIDIICQRDEEDHPVVNIPQLVIHHSPDGFEFGFAGSGPADLALNIVELALHSTHFNGPREKCWRGSCFQRSWELHQEFKRRFIATLPKEGGVIKGEDVLQWLAEHE